LPAFTAYDHGLHPWWVAVSIHQSGRRWFGCEGRLVARGRAGKRWSIAKPHPSFEKERSLQGMVGRQLRNVVMRRNDVFFASMLENNRKEHNID
jgi:hypothetical protein